MPSTNLREKLDGMIWEPTDLDITTYFRFDGASFLAPVAVMECTPSDCCAEAPTTRKGNKGVNTLRFAAATNSFNANVKTKTVEMTEATEAARTSESAWKSITYTNWLIHISASTIKRRHTQGPLL